MVKKRNRIFPVFAATVLILAVLWILQDVGVMNVKIPWFPIIIAAIAVGGILDFYSKRR